MSVAIDALRPVRAVASEAPRRPWFGTLVLTAVTALVVFWVLASQAGPLNLEVHGVRSSDPAALRQATLGYLGQGLFQVSKRVFLLACRGLQSRKLQSGLCGTGGLGRGDAGPVDPLQPGPAGLDLTVLDLK